VELPVPAFEEKVEKDKRQEPKLVVQVPETVENPEITGNAETETESTETVVAENLTVEQLEEEQVPA